MPIAAKRALPIMLAVLLCALLIPLGAAAQTSTTTSSLIVKLIPGLSVDEQAAVITRDGGVETSSIPAYSL